MGWMEAVANATGKRYAILALAGFYAMHAGDGTVFVGSDALANVAGMTPGKVREYRAWLVEHGFLTWTGEYRQRAKVWRLTLPD